MLNQNPSLFGLGSSNRDFSQKEAWGKNQFNSSFPAALSAYLSFKGLENVYLYLDNQMKVKQGYIKTSKLYGIAQRFSVWKFYSSKG